MGEQYPPTPADYAYDAADNARRLVRGMADRVAAVERQVAEDKLEAEALEVAEDKLEAEALEVAKIAAWLCGGALAVGQVVQVRDAITYAMKLLAEARAQVGEPRA